MDVLLISTYELGRQPFGLASPAAWLRRDGVRVECLDLAVQPLDEGAVAAADLIAFHLPMHTATRLALGVVGRVREINEKAHLCAYGLYAPVNESLLRRRGFETLIGGEYEAELAALVQELAAGDRDERRGDAPADGQGGSSPRNRSAGGPTTTVSHDRLEFRVPDREGLPELERYARLVTPDGDLRRVGATAASRGCKHRCRHCPVVPVYGGRFRVVQRDVVLEDVRRQVEAGAEHVTFTDPDFLNGPRHAFEIVEALHEAHPGLTYDVTIKVEHLLRHRDELGLLRETGCAFVTTAVESVDDRVLERLEKGHTRDDFLEVVSLCREVDLPLHPTFVAFHPWLGVDDYREFLTTIEVLDLTGNVAPIQLAIRLLIPAGSRLLELDEVRGLVGPFDEEALCYPWDHPDPRIDALQGRVETLVERASDAGPGRRGIFAAVKELALREPDAWVADEATVPATVEEGSSALGEEIGRRAGETGAAGSDGLPEPPPRPDRATVPYLTEPWYC